ncbi:MAG: acyl--CoA ligase [Rhizobiales bacterium]|nr:acyl--CoA ligase [Hyphomicrobiales bacterium]
MLMHQPLLDNAARRPDAPAFRWVDRDRALSYAQAVTQMDRMAGALHHLGARKGDRIAVFAHNGLDYLIAMFGAWRIGAIAALVNVKFADELAYYLGDHDPTIVIYTHDMVDAVRRARAAAPSIRALVCMDGPQDGAESLPALLEADLPPPPDPWDEDAVAHLSYTSGTTGKPKGACLRHEPTVRAARCIAERLRLRPTDMSFGATALSSSYQLVGNILPPLACGAPFHVMGRWTQQSGWDALDAAGATAFVANPTLLSETIVESRRRGRAPGRLRYALTGGAPMPPSLKSAWRDEFALPVVESYGQSELGGFVALGYPDLVPAGDSLQRVGPALPDKEVRTVDMDDRPVGPGVIGEIVLRGGFMAGYWGNPEKTAEATRGDWLRTGDLGVIDADGHVTMRGRRAELILVSGRPWYPRDVEEALCEQPGVRQAALIGLPDAARGSRPTAFVTLHDGASVDPAALTGAIAKSVDDDVSLLDIRVVEELPMTPTGKIAKAELAAMAQKG